MATVDARPIIAAGGEPFDTIMLAVAALGESEELVVLAGSSRCRSNASSPLRGSRTRRSTLTVATGRSHSGDRHERGRHEPCRRAEQTAVDRIDTNEDHPR